MAFKLKSAERPFALIKIGDIGKWLKEELEGYDILEGFEDEGFFQRLNEDDSDINILMGSRSFYEGWDSNRPNVITFINIGTGTEARKFILQSVGRGVRIEPLPGRRKRLQNLYNAGDAHARALYPKIRNRVLLLETLFIFGTNRQALQTVIGHLDLEQGKEAVHQIALELNREAVDDHLLLIPTYRLADRPLVEQRAVRKFEIAADELDLLNRYVAHLGDGRLLVARHGATPRQVGLLQRCLAAPQEHFNTSNGRRYGRVDLALDRLPYYDPDANRIRRFIPDFIFWLQKGDDYFIAFVDPKGMQHTGYQHKPDGYEALFVEADSTVRVLEHNGLKVRVCPFLYTQDANRAPLRYAAYWHDHPEALANGILRAPHETPRAG